MSFKDDFTNALDEQGIAWRESGTSLVIQDCPACGSQSWKVHLRIDDEDFAKHGVYFGRCYAGQCQENYSSFKYLMAFGLEYFEVAGIHGRDPLKALGGLSPDVDDLMDLVAPEVAKTVEPLPELEEVDISGFYPLKDYLEHPAAKYALSRGADPSLDNVMIDAQSNAVVFVVRDGGKVVGYQKRFVHPISPHLKAKSSSGFNKSEHILCFPRPGAKILVCEGPFTAVAAWRYGYHAVCTFGSMVSEKQVKKIAQLAEELKQPVGVAFDLDGAGEKGFAQIRAGMFWENREIFKVLVDKADLPDKYDLNDALRDGLALKEVQLPWGGPAVPSIPEFI